MIEYVAGVELLHDTDYEDKGYGRYALVEMVGPHVPSEQDFAHVVDAVNKGFRDMTAIDVFAIWYMGECVYKDPGCEIDIE